MQWPVSIVKSYIILSSWSDWCHNGICLCCSWLHETQGESFKPHETQVSFWGCWCLVASNLGLV